MHPLEPHWYLAVIGIAPEHQRRGNGAALLAALDNWGPHDPPHFRRLMAIARAADPDPFRDQLRDADVFFDPKVLRDLAERADVASLTPATLQSLALRLSFVGEKSAAAELLARATRQYPSDFWLRFDAGTVLEELH